MLQTADSVLYDERTALRRVRKSGRLYGVESVSGLFLTERDFSNAREMYDTESRIVLGSGKSLTDDGLFRGAVYCLLASFQDYLRQIEIFSSILSEGLDTPENMLGNNEKFGRIMKGAVFNPTKSKWIYKLSAEWTDLDLCQRIGNGIRTGRDNEVRLREELIRDVDGFGKKTASLLLRMCGSENLVPIDTRMATAMYFHGYPFEIERYRVDRSDEGKKSKKRKMPIRGGKYLELESFAFDLADKYETSGHMLQLAFWTKYSTFNKSVGPHESGQKRDA